MASPDSRGLLGYISHLCRTEDWYVKSFLQPPISGGVFSLREGISVSESPTNNLRPRQTYVVYNKGIQIVSEPKTVHLG